MGLGKMIHELVTRTFGGSVYLPFDMVNTDPSTMQDKPYISGKCTGDDVAMFVATTEQYTQSLLTEAKTLTGSINELLTYVLNIAEEYDDEATYDVGDYCIHEGVLYKCTVAIAVAEAWNSAHWTSTLIVDEFGTGGGGASVTLGTTVPSDASGENGDLYVQYDSVTYAVIEYFVKINNSWRKSPYSRVVALTQAEYNLITPDPTTLYIITDAQSSYALKSDIDTALSGITLNSNPATGDYHFELSTGWSVTNFMFSRQGNRCYLSGVFTCSTPISTWQFIGKFANLPVSKNINPLTELIVFVGADNEPDTPTSRSFARIVLRSTDGYLQASNDMPTARRLFISISWIAQTDEV